MGGVGRAISVLRKESRNEYALQSLSAAKCEVNMGENSLMPTPVGQKEIWKAVQFAKEEGNEDRNMDLSGLIVCTKWPGEEGNNLVEKMNMSRDADIWEDGLMGYDRRTCG